MCYIILGIICYVISGTNSNILRPVTTRGTFASGAGCGVTVKGLILTYLVSCILS